jgi:hypothetical protein
LGTNDTADGLRKIILGSTATTCRGRKYAGDIAAKCWQGGGLIEHNYYAHRDFCSCDVCPGQSTYFKQITMHQVAHISNQTKVLTKRWINAL